MSERNERPLYEGNKQAYRGADRRKTIRRKSDRVKHYLKYFLVIVLTIVVVKLFKI